MPYQRILIAVDGTAYSKHAVERGSELARLVKAELALVFVVDLRKGIADLDTNAMPQEAVGALMQEGRDTLHDLSTLAGMPVRTFLPDGIPSDGILRTAEEWNADLIITGTHSRTGLAHFFAGSVAEHVVRHAAVPVMVVPLPE